ncbi:MAG: PIN domain-containing protein [Deltaproteobacteria bacterium]|nr:PIN domain-containing protein [Deltaproteobacteria bacterium]
MKRVLYDTNVLLDVTLRREPYLAASAAALDAVGQGQVEGYIAGHAVTTLFYVLRRELGTTKSRRILADFLSKMHVAPVTDAGIRQALSGPFKDFEDAVSHAAAQEAGVAVIVTRNVSDFTQSIIPAVLPEVFRP